MLLEAAFPMEVFAVTTVSAVNATKIFTAVAL